MGYSSSLSDKECEIIEPLLPKRKKTRPPTWTKRQIFRWSILPTQEWMQLVRLTEGLAAILNCVLALQAMARVRSTEENHEHIRDLQQ